MAEQAAQHGFVVEHEVWLWLDREHGVYHYGVHSDRDVGATSGMTSVIFDANNGALKVLSLPSGQHAGSTVTNWLYALHQGEVFGLPYRIFVCMMGLVITMLSVTGVYLWLKKRRSQRIARLRRVILKRESALDMQMSESAGWGEARTPTFCGG